MSFQIIESNRSLPSQGPNVQFRGSTDTGEGMTARAMGALGSSVANLGIGLFVAQGQAELTEKMAEAKEKISKMHLDLEKETDPERYQQIFQETWADVEAIEVKNGWASREWKLQMPELKARQQEVVGLAQRQGVRENHTIALANAEADWLANPTGDGTKYKNLLVTQIEQNWLSDEEAGLKLKQTQEKVQKQKVLKEYDDAMRLVGVDPQGAYQKYDALVKGGGTDLEHSSLDAGHFRSLKNIAEGDMSLTTAARKQYSEKIEAEITADIARFNSSTDANPQKTIQDLRVKIDKAWADGALDGTQIRELTHFVDSRANSAGKQPDENDPYALAEAYKTITSKMSQKQKFEKLLSLEKQLKPTTVDGFIQDIYKPETVSNEIYKAYSQALTSLQTGKMFSSETTQNINLSVKAHDLLRLFAEQNPDATAEDYAKFFNRLIENQTSAWGILPGGKSFWNSFRKEKGELRYSIPQNIEAMQKEIGKPATSKQYKVGDVVPKNNKTWRILTLTPDGQPDNVEEVK